MKIRTRPSLCVWIFTFAYQTISTYRQRRRGGLARPGSWARRGRQCRVCKLWGKGWGLCKQVFMSRSEDLPITVCPSFYPFLICQSAGTDFLIFNIWSRLHACFLLLTEPTNLILMADRSGACLMLVLIFITRHCQLILTLPLNISSHLSSPGKVSCVSSILRAMIRRWFERQESDHLWTIPNFPPLTRCHLFLRRSQTLRSRILFLAAIPVFCLQSSELSPDPSPGSARINN